MTFKLELFVNDLSASIDFYRRILGFIMGERQTDGYTPMTNGDVYLALNLRVNLPDDHPIQAAAGERLGRGVEPIFAFWIRTGIIGVFHHEDRCECQQAGQQQVQLLK